MNSKLNKTPLFKKKWVYDICCGGGEYSHDNHMANIFRPIRCKMFEIYAIRMDLYKKMKKPGYASREFYNEYRNVEKKLLEKYGEFYDMDKSEILNVNNKEVVEEIRDYLKNVWTCLIKIFQSEDHRVTLSKEFIYRRIYWSLGVDSTKI